MNKDYRARKIQPNMLPQTRDAIQMYPGSLSEPAIFGLDPLGSKQAKQDMRLAAFTSSYSFENLFYEVANGNGTTFTRALIFFIDITYRLSVSS